MYPRDDVDRLYMSRREGGRGLASIEDSIDAPIQCFEDYIEKREGKQITATGSNTDDMRTSGTTITRKQKWEGKQLYGRFKWLTSDIAYEKTWTWLRKRNVKRETESPLKAAQNNAISRQRTNHIKARIDKTQHNSRCRLCGDRNETINHIISECSKLAQQEYKNRYDSLGIVQKIEVWPYEKMVYTELRICPGEWDAQTPQGFLYTNESPNLSQTTRSYNNQQKKRELAGLWTLLAGRITE